MNLNSISASVILLTYILKLTFCQRRIVNGIPVQGEPKYLVYFVKAFESDRRYTGWVCGGSIVHPLYILTSAACLDDVRFVYAIAGYKKYIKTEDINRDECTKRFKKRVVARCFQKEFDLENMQTLNWNSRDIGLAKVESPYDFRDATYLLYCSYQPDMIPINYHSNFEDEGTQAVTFGWGHKKYFRPLGDTNDYNERYVHYASTVVISKQGCKDKLIGHTTMKTNVDLYLICTLGPGILDENGSIIDHSGFFGDDVVSNCNITKKTVHHNTRKKIDHSYPLDSYSTNLANNFSAYDSLKFRRQGPCQNDHGGPLVAWIGGKEHVIGVACGFQVNAVMACVGPFLYTSTYKNGEFLYCILKYSRSALCLQVPHKEKKGLRMVEEEINWDTETKRLLADVYLERKT